jgi:hypothetical protein
MILISQSELKLLKSIKAQQLTQKDWEIIMENKNTLTRYFNNMITNIQIDITLKKYRGNEEKAWNKIEALQELILGIDNIENAFDEYQEKKKQAEEKKAETE